MEASISDNSERRKADFRLLVDQSSKAAMINNVTNMLPPINPSAIERPPCSKTPSMTSYMEEVAEENRAQVPPVMPLAKTPPFSTS